MHATMKPCIKHDQLLANHEPARELLVLAVDRLSSESALVTPSKDERRFWMVLRVTGCSTGTMLRPLGTVTLRTTRNPRLAWSLGLVSW